MIKNVIIWKYLLHHLRQIKFYEIMKKTGKRGGHITKERLNGMDEKEVKAKEADEEKTKNQGRRYQGWENVSMRSIKVE